MSKITNARWLLRIAFAFAFFYVALASIKNPEAWIVWLPQFAVRLSPVPPQLLMDIMAFGQIALGLWLLYGRRLRWSAGVAAVFLFSIAVFNLSAMEIVFRDISLGLAALALAVLAPEEG
ncbi:MAG: DoxX family membrane protein [Candidatus Harrisonbacteria bacterium]|nr:DoxX family membrane protein [Candidatus Harrisonbacteria bacterium]